MVSGSLSSLTGCVTGRNGFSQFYQDRAGAAITKLLPYSGTTKIITASPDLKNDVKELERNGYFLIGESAFHGPPQGKNALLFQAKKVGADVVLISSIYLGSQQTAVPFTQYNPGQTYTTTSSGTVNANAYGSGGYAYGTGNYSGSSTTTSPGTFTTEMIPVTVHHYQYDAGFYRKKGPMILGVGPRPLPQELRQRLERNTGVLVWVVRNDSPAFNANILEGDVILQMNGEEISSVADYVQKSIEMPGQKIDIEIWRNGQSKKIPVQLNNKP
jgi:membrane-associated protease RseP (regulator of RpoE activity)